MKMNNWTSLNPSYQLSLGNLAPGCNVVYAVNWQPSFVKYIHICVCDSVNVIVNETA